MKLVGERWKVGALESVESVESWTVSEIVC